MQKYKEDNVISMAIMLEEHCLVKENECDVPCLDAKYNTRLDKSQTMVMATPFAPLTGPYAHDNGNVFCEH